MNKNRIEEGIALIVIGGFFLLNSLNIIGWDIFGYIFQVWPVALILLGLGIVVNKPWMKYVNIVIFILTLVGYYLYAEGYMTITW